MVALFNKIIILGIVLVTIGSANGAVTIEQMEMAGKMMRDICLPRYKAVTEEIANGLRHSVFPEQKEVKCYVNCIMDMMGVVRKGKFNPQVATKQIEMLLPDHYKEHYHQGTEKCKDATKGFKDHCEASYNLLKCYEAAVPEFYFP